ncbi:MAG: HEPN domain-containing protein [Flavisolibacter sp.]|nr:HEPN domain-containing protein [Flavisolibacter sp.]
MGKKANTAKDLKTFVNSKKCIMKPFTIYHTCHDSFSLLQKSLVDIIVKVTNPDMIFLLGVSLQRRKSESIFNEQAPSAQHISDCTLLILISDLSTNGLHEWQDKIENHCKRIMPVTTLVLKTATFQLWLKAGHQFALSAWNASPMLYHADSVCKEDILVAPAPVNNKDAAKQWEEGLSKAKEFLVGAELYRVRKQHKMSAFMLHQSAEHALLALLVTGTGYHPNTHSIDRLIRYGSLIAYQLPDVFPRKTDQDKRLFSLLQKAYIDTRYKEDYDITEEELLTLAEKVSRIHEILSITGAAFINKPLVCTQLSDVRQQTQDDI